MLLGIKARNQRYGWIPDLPDQRDFPFAKLSLTVPPLPRKVDLRLSCTPVEDQESLGSCTACALVGNLEFLVRERLKRDLDFSRLFLYYNERLIQKNTAVDSGASLRDGIKSLVKVGDCLEDLWPYVISEFATLPPDPAYQNASEYQIIAYYRLRTLSEMKTTLLQGCPFVFGFAVYDSFETPDVARTGRVPIPQPEETMLGGHAVMAAGYDDEISCLIVRNSWGQSWGDRGYFYLPYAYVENPALASDFWTVRALE